ncbi:hypothetical protein AB833_05420 [Chromatiales bacterium (ex Bugula neritina AB1)]|nr:hypothetical protein AB833_05420 [Chromatiales bacterium (ex Bugula neritina AB1)]
MDLLITVTKAQSAQIVAPLLQACVRRGCDWHVFLTHHGVQVLQQNEIIEIMSEYRERVVACHDSWHRFGEEGECPVTVGSQTNHSEMAARAGRLVSL